MRTGGRRAERDGAPIGPAGPPSGEIGFDADDRDAEPRWQAVVAVVATGGLYVALPDGLTVGPRWWFPLVVGTLLATTIATHRGRHHHVDRILGFVVTSLITIQMIVSVVLLVRALPGRQEPANDLLLSATSLWLTNVLVFALWYWRLDAGGPHGRESRSTHTGGAFLFPQMTMGREAKMASGFERWSPNFVDYLFLSFTTSTAFSPTDTPALARWAKVLMMLQSLISLAVLALLAARAINIL